MKSLHYGDINKAMRLKPECSPVNLDIETARLLKSIMQSLLICPEDQGAIRAQQADGTITIPVNALAPGLSAAAFLVGPVGLDHCFSLGIESVIGIAATDSYQLQVFRNGVGPVATWVRAELAPLTANPRADDCPCSVCVGAIQTLSFVVTNNGPAAYAAVASITLKFCRKYSAEPLINLQALLGPQCKRDNTCG